MGENISSKTLEKLNSIEREIYQVKNESRQDPLNFPIKLNNKIASLGPIVDSGEAKPPDGAYTVFKELSILINEVDTVLLGDRMNKKTIDD